MTIATTNTGLDPRVILNPASPLSSMKTNTAGDFHQFQKPECTIGTKGRSFCILPPSATASPSAAFSHPESPRQFPLDFADSLHQGLGRLSRAVPIARLSLTITA